MQKRTLFEDAKVFFANGEIGVLLYVISAIYFLIFRCEHDKMRCQIASPRAAMKASAQVGAIEPKIISCHLNFSAASMITKRKAGRRRDAEIAQTLASSSRQSQSMMSIIRRFQQRKERRASCRHAAHVFGTGEQRSPGGSVASPLPSGHFTKRKVGSKYKRACSAAASRAKLKHWLLQRR